MLRSVLAGVDALRFNPMRSILSTLGVIIGVAALVAILALGDGLERFSREQLARTTDLHTVTVTPETTARVDGLVVRSDVAADFSREDLASLLANLDGPVRAYRLLTASAWSRPPDSTRDVGILIRALDPEAPIDARNPVLQGSLDAWRSAGSPIRAVLSYAAAHAFFPGNVQQAVGDTVRVGGRPLPVSAVLDGSPEDRPLEVMIPLNEVSDEWLATDMLRPVIVVRADRIEDVGEVARQTRSWVSARFPEGRFLVQSSRARVEQANRVLFVFKLGLAAIAAISLLVGGIGIMNILLASVSERTREIGIRKSMGARSRDVMLQFLAESVMISGVGSLIGILVGMAGAVGATAVIRAMTDAPVHASFTWQSLVVAAGAAMVVGLVFGTVPARKAGRLSPIDAIRHE